MLHIDQIEGQPVLTQREQQILEFVALGLSAKEVAQQVSIAPRTVERHIENIRLKMRARNRTHMVTCAAMAGMLMTQRPQLDQAEHAAAMPEPVLAMEPAAHHDTVVYSAFSTIDDGHHNAFFRRVA